MMRDRTAITRIALRRSERFTRCSSRAVPATTPQPFTLAGAAAAQ